jgi:N-acetylglucosamine kinase-like BadF-type ATPase
LGTWIGIDGGGTRATAVVADDDGTVRARVTGGAALVDPLQPLRGVGALVDLARSALADADITGVADGLCCALAGAGRQSVRDILTAELQGCGVARHVQVIGDARAALEDAFGGAAGVLLIAGTGSAAWAHGPSGNDVRAGGWGQLLGDEGSGYAIGSAALRMTARAADGRSPATALSQRVLEAAGVEAAEELIGWVAAASKARVAALAPIVIDAANEGDANAAAIVDTAAHELAQQVAAVLARSGPWTGRVPVAFAGGLISPGGPLRERAWQAVQQLPFDLELAEERVQAARGAALFLARQHVAQD